MARSLPVSLAMSARFRSDQALQRIMQQQKKLEADLHTGDLQVEFIKDPKYLDLGSFCEQAGVNSNFLNGQKYRDSLKPQIKAFLSDLKRHLVNSPEEEACRISQGNPSQIERFEKLLERAYSQLHAETIRADEAERELKELKSSISPKVVKLSR